MRKLFNLIFSLYMRLRWWWMYKACRYMPKIRRKFPKPPATICGDCKRPFTKIVAIDTGDGWGVTWECENDCGYGEEIEGWFPFVFGWARASDLERIGIEVW